MPCPHNEISIVQRSQQQSAIAAAAYQSGEKLFCEYDQQVKHYPEKRGIVHNEILLPANAPQKYADRNTLWNAAEAVEKQWNSQLARRWVLTIPREIPPDQYAVLVREFCEQQFVSKGMIVDFAIHDPHPPGHNPHAHVLLTMRAMDKHEIAHAKLHDIDLNAPQEEQGDRPDRRTREVQAESIAYTVCQHYGLDTSDYSFGYVAGWSSGRELAELKSSLETIRATAAEIINSIDGHFAELTKAREAAKEQEAETQAAPDLSAEPTVTILWSESDKLREGETIPLSRANTLIEALDEANLESPSYDKTAFRIDYVMNGIPDHYEGRQDLGDGDGSLVEHIEQYHTHYLNNEQWDNYLLQREGKEALEADKEHRAMLLNEFVPYLKLHCNLSEMERAATEALQNGENLTPAETAYHTAMQAYVSECRGLVNQGEYNLPPVPQLADFDAELQAYKEHVKEEIAQEAASAGMTVEEYAANGYEPYTTPEPEKPKAQEKPPEPESPVSEKADTPEQAEPALQTSTPEQPETSVTYYPINEAAAKRAKQAISYSDYKPGSATAEYRHYVDEAAGLAARQKKRVDPSFHAKIDGLLDTYARKLAANMNKGYEITARVPSILITGGSNFPVRKKEKQNAAADKNMQEFTEIQGLLDKIRSTGMGGISADDPNAVSKLESKLAKLEQAQEMFFLIPYNTQKTVLPNFYKRKTLQSSKDYNASQTVFSCVLDVYSSPASTFLISFAVAVIICNPVSLIPSSSVSSCLRCVDLLATLSGKKN